MLSSIECVFIDFRGLGLILSVPFVPRFYAVLQNYAKYAAPSLGWGHVIFMPIFGSFDVTLVTWAVCLILIGREKFCCAVIGWDPVETPLLLETFFQRDSIPILVSRTVKTRKFKLLYFRNETCYGNENLYKDLLFVYLQPSVNKNT